MTEKNIFLEENKQQEFFKIKSFFSSVVFFLAKVFKYYVCTYTYTYIPTSYNIIGSPINMYLFHFYTLFSSVLQTTGCNATAKGLKPGHLYQFEVSAINKEGQSEPILTGDPILAENPYSKNTSLFLNIIKYKMM